MDPSRPAMDRARPALDLARTSGRASQPHRCKRKMHVITLATVLEHCEAAAPAPAVAIGAPQPPAQRRACNEAASSGKKTRPMRILSKLRDGYVRLMNDMASGADFAGAASFYGCPQGVDCTTFAVASAARSLQREEQEQEAIAMSLRLQSLVPSLIRC